MNKFTSLRIEKMLYEAFNEVSSMTREEDIITSFLIRSTKNDLNCELSNLKTKSYNGIYKFNTKNSKITAKFKNGQLHSSKEPAWVEKFEDGRRNQAWVKDGLVLAFKADDEKFIFDEETYWLEEDNKGQKFKKIVASFEDQPKLKIAPK